MPGDSTRVNNQREILSSIVGGDSDILTQNFSNRNSADMSMVHGPRREPTFVPLQDPLREISNYFVFENDIV